MGIKAKFSNIIPTVLYNLLVTYLPTTLPPISLTHLQKSLFLTLLRLFIPPGLSSVQFSSVQSLSCVRLFATTWTAACQASLSINNSQSLLKLMSIELVMPPKHLILCCTLLHPLSIFPRIRSFPVSEFFASGGQSIGVSASASVLPMNIQD